MGLLNQLSIRLGATAQDREHFGGGILKDTWDREGGGILKNTWDPEGRRYAVAAGTNGICSESNPTA